MSGFIDQENSGKIRDRMELLSTTWEMVLKWAHDVYHRDSYIKFTLNAYAKILCLKNHFKSWALRFMPCTQLFEIDPISNCFLFILPFILQEAERNRRMEREMREVSSKLIEAQP